MLKKLDDQSILALCANQVILDLGGCLKELIENSIDAKSTFINIQLENYGKDYIEVIDNGTGIDMKNMAVITQKGATSKIREFDDLDKLETFGFRGEALNSLRLLSNLIIITRTKEDDNAWRYTFTSSGEVEKTEASREVGTTVIIEKIFSRIPVRLADLENNIKSQYTKLCTLVSEYAVISLGVRIVMHNKVTGKKPEMVLNSGMDAKNSLRNRIFMVLGAKYEEAVEEFEFEVDETSSISGYLLKNVTSGSGRENSWLKKNFIFCYANSRPINMPKKLFDALTNVYKQYNFNKKVIAIINIRVRGEDLDLNLSPDKRDVYFTNEKLLVEKFAENLIHFIEERNMIQKVVKSESDTQIKISDVFKKTAQFQSAPEQTSEGKKSSDDKENERSALISEGKKRLLNSGADQSMDEGGERRVLRLRPEDSQEEKHERVTPVKKTFSFISKQQEDEDSKMKEEVQFSLSRHKTTPSFKSTSDSSDFKSQLASRLREKSRDKSSSAWPGEHLEKKLEGTSALRAPEESAGATQSIQGPKLSLNFDANGKLKIASSSAPIMIERNPRRAEQRPERCEQHERPQVSGGIFEIIPKKPTQMEVLPDDIEEIEKYSDLNQNSQRTTEGSPKDITFKSEIAEVQTKALQGAIKPYDANTELMNSYNDSDFSFTKEMFKKLKVLGQYNSSFIITYLQEKNRIFIVDQHAADEKRNFERFLQEREFASQILLKPIILCLPLLEINIVKENKHIFEKNGFSLKIKEEEEEIHIYRFPCFKSLSFDKEDFLELIYMLRNECYGLYKKEDLRPKKVKTAIAMKACHASVRAGDPLDLRKMRDVVEKLETLNSPWNCPHGRPTMVKSTALSEMMKKIRLEPPERPKYDFDQIFCEATNC